MVSLVSSVVSLVLWPSSATESPSWDRDPKLGLPAKVVFVGGATTVVLFSLLCLPTILIFLTLLINPFPKSLSSVFVDGIEDKELVGLESSADRKKKKFNNKNRKKEKKRSIPIVASCCPSA